MGAWLPSLLRIDTISVLCFFTLVFPSALAQSVTLIPAAASDSFPACALKCPTLTQAQDSCVPPAAPVTNQATYVSCFCQSTLLAPLHSSPNGVCDSSCPNAADLTTLQKWYTEYCASGGNVPTATTSTTTAAGATASSTSTKKADVNAQPTHSWISTHYGWVIMIIVLAVGFTALALVGIWLKRRYDAKRPGLDHGDTSAGGSSGLLVFPRQRHDAARVSVPSAANMEMWGPPQAMAHTRSLDFANLEPTAAFAASSKTRMSAVSTLTPDRESQATNPSRNSHRSSTRLQKAGGPSQDGDIEIREV